MKTLENVSETLWIPLFGKAIESKRKNALISDPKAVSIAEKACEMLPELNRWWKQLSKETQALMIWRNESLDGYVSQFITNNPNATVVNLGAGLCTRFERIDNGKINWLEFDLPDVKDVWLHFNEESDRHKYYTQNIFEDEWIKTIQSYGNEKVMFVAEGLLMYFSKKQVKALLEKLSDSFPNGEIAFEAYSKIALKRPHPDVKKTTAKRFENPWGILTGKEFEHWKIGLVHLEDNYLSDNKKAMQRMPLSIKGASKLPYLRKVGKMVHLRFQG